MREWVKSQEILPIGVLAAWHAIESGRAFAGIFQIGDGTFVACWHPIGKHRPTVVRDIGTFSEARDVVAQALATTLVVPRTIVPRGW